jgi:hypothetical protein
VADYHQVTEAMQRRDSAINEALAEAVNKKRKAQADALERIRQAQATAHETVQQAKAGQFAFLARHDMRNHLGWRDEVQLLGQALRAAWNGQNPSAAYEAYDHHRRARLSQQATLTDFRLYWDALTKVLAGREKVLIDADKVPGRRHLLLLDPDQLRPTMPILMPSERPRGLRDGSFEER